MVLHGSPCIYSYSQRRPKGSLGVLGGDPEISTTPCRPESGLQKIVTGGAPNGGRSWKPRDSTPAIG